LVLAYAAGVADDERSVETLRSTFPGCIAIPIETDRHNLLGFFQRAQVLAAFLECLLADGDILERCRDRLAQLTQAGNVAKNAPLPPAARGAKPRMEPTPPRHPGLWPLRAVRRLLSGWMRPL
jgi:hypothetical protein